jgi:enoyl-CoA hydratase/carnithine racemase
MATQLHYELRGHTAILTLDGPDTRNALSGNTLFDAFEQIVPKLNSDLNVRAVILTGAGKAFCSGGNVREMRDKQGIFAGGSAEIASQYRAGIQRIPRALAQLDLPIIAAVNGAAIGAGLDLACMCDIRLAAPQAIFAESFIKLGIIPGVGGTWLLPRIISHARAAEMTFTGEAIDSQTALSLGLISKIVPEDQLMVEALLLAGRMAANPPQAVRWTKELMRLAQTQSFDRLLERSADIQALAHNTHDHMEAVTAMLDKRQAVFQGN